jgi:hypothetical protein
MSIKKIKTEPIKTVLVITVGLILVHIITKQNWLIYGALVIGVFGLISTYIAQKIDYGWMKLTALLGLVMPNILLSIVFYIFLTPIALLSRVFGEKNRLSLRNENASLFKDYNKVFEKDSFEKPW